MLTSATDEAAAEHRLNELLRLYPLPAGCALRETFFQRISVGELHLFMAGLIADSPAQPGVTGSAAGQGGFPIDRAYFELLERSSIMIARAAGEALPVRDRNGAAKGVRACSRVFVSDSKPEAIRTSLSNGVALHETWTKACDAAICELIERDRILRSFRGEFSPRKLDSTDRRLARALRAHYALEAYEFGPRRKGLRHTTAGLFLFPRKSTEPLSYGFGAATSPKAALANATKECLQRLAFLWGEDIPAHAPVAAPNPDYHQEYYLFPAHHELLRRWLAGRTPKRKASSTRAFDGERVTFVDLTPDSVRTTLAIAKASAPGAQLLRFGTAARSRGAPHPLA